MVNRSRPATATVVARSKWASASSVRPRTHASRPSETSVSASAQPLPSARSFTEARRSSRSAFSTSFAEYCTRAVARAARAMAAASSSPVSVKSRTHSPSPAITSFDGRCHISPHSARNHATARVCCDIGASLPSSSSIHTRTPPKSPAIHQ